MQAEGQVPPSEREDLETKMNFARWRGHRANEENFLRLIEAECHQCPFRDACRLLIAHVPVMKLGKHCHMELTYLYERYLKLLADRRCITVSTHSSIAS